MSATRAVPGPRAAVRGWHRWGPGLCVCLLLGCGGDDGATQGGVTADAAPGAAEAAPSDGADASRAPRHVLLISVDTLRADHLGCYGYERETSPWIDSLAARGVRASEAFAQATMTLSSHASLFTSLYPPQFGLVRADGSNTSQAATRLRLPDAVTTLAETLRAAGYRTAAFTGGALVDPRYGLAQGFQHFQAATGYEQSGLATSVPWLLEWTDQALAEDADSPLFLFLHSFDVHDPYRAPAPFSAHFSSGDDHAFEANYGLPPNVPALGRGALGASDALRDEVEALYDNGIRAADEALAGLERALTERGLWDDMLVVLVSDHGEEFLEHGGWGHGPRPHREVLHVPFILRLPGDRHAGLLLEQALPLLDVAPTVVDLLGLPRPDSWRGLSQAPVLRGESTPEHRKPRLLYADNQLTDPDIRRVQQGADVLLLDYTQHGQRLFDRGSDPDERHNLAAERSAAADALRQRFEAWLTQLVQESRAFVAVPMQAGDETHWEAQAEMLEALGYVR